MSSKATVRDSARATPDPALLTAADFEDRLRWARAHGHPFYVWPEVPLADWRVALAELQQVVTPLLLGRDAVTLQRADPAFVRALGVAAFTSGMGPLLGWWIERGVLRAPEPVQAMLELHLHHGRQRAERMHRALGDAANVLAAASVPVTVLKGAHTAHVYFAEPGLRTGADLDLLVAKHQMQKAETALAAAGYTIVPGSRLGRPRRSDWQPPGAPVTVRSLAVHHEDNPYTIDLHESLEVSFFGVRRIRFGEITNLPTVPAPWAGAETTALAEPLLVAYHAAHASLGLYNLTMIRLSELVLMLRRDAGVAFAWDDLTKLLQRARAERFVYPAFELVDRLVPGSVEPALLASLARAAPPRLKRVIAKVTPASTQRHDRVALRESFMWTRTPMEMVRRAAYMLLPWADSGSLRRLVRIYQERMYRLRRGRVELRSNTTEPR